jgi:nitrogen fixation protein
VRVSLCHLKTGTILLREGPLTENTEQMRLISYSESNLTGGLITLKNPGPPGWRLCKGLITPSFKK